MDRRDRATTLAAAMQLNPTLAICCSVLALSGLAACGDDSGDTEASATTTQPATGSGDPTSPGDPASEPATTETPEGCAGDGPEVPDDAASDQVDLDGDGQDDTVWLAAHPDGSREMGVLTAAGGGERVEIDSASPVPLVTLVADADQEAPVELLVSDNRVVQLWAFADCSLQPVIGPDGEPYRFDLGFAGNGTGVGCIDADGDGQRDLVGLNVTDRNEQAVSWSRTVVELDGLQATHGTTETGTFQPGEDDDAIETLNGVSCGELTAADDGIHQPRP